MLFWYVAAESLGQPALEVGETRSCHIQLAPSPTAAINTPYPFSFMVGRDSPPYDLNPDNGLATIVQQLASTKVSALSAAFEIMLIVLIGILGVTAQKRSHRVDSAN